MSCTIKFLKPSRKGRQRAYKSKKYVKLLSEVGSYPGGRGGGSDATNGPTLGRAIANQRIT